MGVVDWLRFFAMRALPLILVYLFFSFLLGRRDRDVLILSGIYLASISSVLARWLYGNVTVLRVSSDMIVATGNLGKVFAKTLTVPTLEVESLRESGGGLYLERDSFWKESGWILPGLNREQGKTVIKTILTRFPEVWEEYDAQAQIPFGFRTGLRPLRLYPSEDEKPDAA